MANYSSATFAILLILAAAMAAPQTASSFPLHGINIVKCWEAISSFKNCVPRVVVPETLNIQLAVTAECCHALEEIRENCFPNIPPTVSFAPQLGSMFQQICGDYSAPAPQPTAGA